MQTPYYGAGDASYDGGGGNNVLARVSMTGEAGVSSIQELSVSNTVIEMSFFFFFFFSIYTLSHGIFTHWVLFSWRTIFLEAKCFGVRFTYSPSREEPNQKLRRYLRQYRIPINNSIRNRKVAASWIS